MIDVDRRRATTQRYFLPLSAVWGEDALTLGPRLPATLAKLRRANRIGAVLDGAVDEEMARSLLAALRARRDRGRRRRPDRVLRHRRAWPRSRTRANRGFCRQNSRTPRSPSATASSSSSTAACSEGLQPDIEVARFLTEETDFEATPALLGTIDWTNGDGTVTTLAAASAFVRNQGDAWTYVTEALDRDMERAADDRRRDGRKPDDDRSWAARWTWARCWAGARPNCTWRWQSGKPGTAFAQEPLTAEGLAGLIDDVETELGSVLDRLAKQRGTLSETARTLADAVLERRARLHDLLEALRGLPVSGGISRIHGDYHLGQVLVVQTDVMIIDFEGEPARSLAERQAKTSPLRDVAGMLRSFDYALWSTARRQIELGADPERTMAGIEGWRASTQGAFLDAYRETMDGSTLHPSDPEFEQALLDLFLIQKAAYEVGYEMAMRPDWIDIPLRGLLALADPDAGIGTGTGSGSDDDNATQTPTTEADDTGETS